MKHNWEYKKLGDICQTISGLWTGKNPPFVNVGVIRNTNFTKQCTLNPDNIFYTDVEVKAFAKRKLQKGDIIIEKSGGSEKQPVGRPILFLLDGEFSFSNFTATLRLKDKSISSIFLHKSLTSLYFNGVTRKLQSRTTGLFNLNWKEYLNLRIPVPPLEVQEQIVAELDKINETIEDCRELLRNLDALAQSLFYDFFGDPAINPKGWRIYKIKDICSVNPTKREIRIPTSSEISFLPMEDLPINARYFTPIKVKTLNEVQNSYTYFSGEDVLFAKVTPCFENGKAGIPVNLINNIGFGSSELFVLRPNFQIINREYIYSFIRTNHFVSEAIKKLSGTSGLRRVPRTVVENFQIPVPPLELQEKFAERIERIEAQKEAVESTIAELQTLLDSRMDYWFN